MLAGRVASQRFIPDKPRTSKNRDTLTSSTVAVPPEEVLFRQKGAPERYEENDFYWAHTELRPDQRLPDSDLLKAIHTYVADFYCHAMPDGGRNDIQSMNETALLAFGILLEESAVHVLGEKGDMAFVEGEPVSNRGDNGASTTDREGDEDTGDSSTVMKEEGEGRGRKRRRLR